MNKHVILSQVFGAHVIQGLVVIPCGDPCVRHIFHGLPLALLSYLKYLLSLPAVIIHITMCQKHHQTSHFLKKYRIFFLTSVYVSREIITAEREVTPI